MKRATAKNSDGRRRHWRKPELKYLGSLAAVVRTGATKGSLIMEGVGMGGGEERMGSMGP